MPTIAATTSPTTSATATTTVATSANVTATNVTAAAVRSTPTQATTTISSRTQMPQYLGFTTAASVATTLLFVNFPAPVSSTFLLAGLGIKAGLMAAVGLFGLLWNLKVFKLAKLTGFGIGKKFLFYSAANSPFFGLHGDYGAGFSGFVGGNFHHHHGGYVPVYPTAAVYYRPVYGGGNGGYVAGGFSGGGYSNLGGAGFGTGGYFGAGYGGGPAYGYAATGYNGAASYGGGYGGGYSSGAYGAGAYGAGGGYGNTAGGYLDSDGGYPYSGGGYGSVYPTAGPSYAGYGSTPGYGGGGGGGGYGTSYSLSPYPGYNGYNTGYNAQGPPGGGLVVLPVSDLHHFRRIDERRRRDDSSFSKYGIVPDLNGRGSAQTTSRQQQQQQQVNLEQALSAQISMIFDAMAKADTELCIPKALCDLQTAPANKQAATFEQELVEFFRDFEVPDDKLRSINENSPSSMYIQYLHTSLTARNPHQCQQIFSRCTVASSFILEVLKKATEHSSETPPNFSSDSSGKSSISSMG